MDLRMNAWVARREQLGPKTIDQVHADARREEANRARAAAGGPSRGSRGGDYRSGGGGLDAYGGPPTRCGADCKACLYAGLEHSSGLGGGIGA